jgi:hypothetical protein
MAAFSQSWPRADAGSLPTENASFWTIAFSSSSTVAFGSLGKVRLEAVDMSGFVDVTRPPFWAIDHNVSKSIVIFMLHCNMTS